MNGLVTTPLDDEALPGVTYIWEYDLEGVDLTGYTAALFWDGLVVGPTSATVTVDNTGTQPISTISVEVIKASTASWVPGLYPYRCVVSFPAPSTDNAVVVYGSLLVRTARPVS